MVDDMTLLTRQTTTLFQELVATGMALLIQTKALIPVSPEDMFELHWKPADVLEALRLSKNIAETAVQYLPMLASLVPGLEDSAVATTRCLVDTDALPDDIAAFVTGASRKLEPSRLPDAGDDL